MTEADVTSTVDGFVRKSESSKAQAARGVGAVSTPRLTFRPVQTSSRDLVVNRLPEIDWVWPELIATNELAVFSAQSGLGKTWTVYSAALAQAVGMPLWEKFIISGPQSVLVIDEEKSVRFSQIRMSKLAKGMGISTERWQDEVAHRFHLYNRQSFILDRYPSVGPAPYDVLERVVEEQRPSVVYFDSLSCIHSGDENSNQVMHGFFQRYLKPLTAHTTLVVIHHHRKPGEGKSSVGGYEARGASSIPAAVDTHITLAKGGGGGKLKVSHVKSSLVGERGPFTLRMEDTANGGVRVFYDGEYQGGSSGTCRDEVVKLLKNADPEGLYTDEFDVLIKGRSEAGPYGERTVHGVLGELYREGLTRKHPTSPKVGERVRHIWNGSR